MSKSLLIAAMCTAFGFGQSLPKRVKTNRGKATPELVNKRTASKSQRTMLTIWGHRDNVGARKIERRAKHTIKGASL